MLHNLETKLMQFFFFSNKQGERFKVADKGRGPNSDR